MTLAVAVALGAPCAAAPYSCADGRLFATPNQLDRRPEPAGQPQAAAINPRHAPPDDQPPAGPIPLQRWADRLGWMPRYRTEVSA